MSISTKLMIFYILIITLAGASFLDGHQKRGWIVLGALGVFTVALVLMWILN